MSPADPGEPLRCGVAGQRAGVLISGGRRTESRPRADVASLDDRRTWHRPGGHSRDDLEPAFARSLPREGKQSPSRGVPRGPCLHDLFVPRALSPRDHPGPCACRILSGRHSRHVWGPLAARPGRRMPGSCSLQPGIAIWCQSGGRERGAGRRGRVRRAGAGSGGPGPGPAGGSRPPTARGSRPREGSGQPAGTAGSGRSREGTPHAGPRDVRRAPLGCGASVPPGGSPGHSPGRPAA